MQELQPNPLRDRKSEANEGLKQMQKKTHIGASVYACTSVALQDYSDETPKRFDPNA